MATEVVVKESLSKELIDAGAELTRKLDEAKYIVNAAFWLYLADSSAWRFVVASPSVRIDGPMKAYRKVQSILGKAEEVRQLIPLKNITVVDSNDPLVQLMRQMLQTGPEISGVRFTNNTINGHTIDDAYIYRMT